MQNGYFRLVKDSKGYGIALYQPRGYGEAVRAGEVFKYLDDLHISYDKKRLEMEISFGGDVVFHLGSGECPICQETCYIEVSDDGMLATVRFIPASEGGKRMTMSGFRHELDARKISYGIEDKDLREHFNSGGIYCTDILVARGRQPVQGRDAVIEYSFDTDNHKRPAHKDDGRVDYFNIGIISFCRKGDVLARIIPEIVGENGYDVYGKLIKPRDVKRETLKSGKNVEMSQDKLTLTALVDGHVSLADQKVSVSNVYQVKDVGVSTGNIDFEGSVIIAGNVSANFEVKAGGNVVVNGLVEGAQIIAGGDIIIAKGMNGMGRGVLRAGGNIIVKFLENAQIVSGGYLETEAILHCTVSAGSDVRVGGRKGILVGGHVQAANMINAKSIGTSMGVATVVEVGVDPQLKAQYDRMQKAISDGTKTINAAQVILQNFRENLKKGRQYNDGQLRYMKSVTVLVQEKTDEVEQANMRLEKLRDLMDVQKQAEVVVNEQIYPNTTIVIGEINRVIQQNYRYCKFIREDGEIRMVGL